MKLTIQIAKKLNSGDYFEYIYPSTEINKNEVILKAIFIGLELKNEAKIILRHLNDFEPETFGKISDSTITIPSDFHNEIFKVWRNGFKDVEIIRINNETIR